MAILKLKADPTFPIAVKIHVPGSEEPGEVTFTCRHRTRDEVKKFNDSAKDRADLDLCSDIIVGWDLAEKFTRANLSVLLQSYPAAAASIYRAYLKELSPARLGN